MKKSLLHIPLLFLFLAISFFSFGQNFSPLQPITKETLNKNQQTLLEDYSQTFTFKQDTSQIKAFISGIQQQYNTPNFSTQISLPNFNGSTIDFKIQNSRTLSASFQQENNIIKTFFGSSEDGKYSLRLTLSQMGVMAKITETTSHNTWYIMPLDMHQSNTLVMYAANDPKIWQDANFSCQAIEVPQLEQKPSSPLPPLIKMATFGDCQLRSYRFAVAASAEYTNWAGSQANAMANIANTVNNINEVYERDLTVHLDLYTTNSIVFTNSATQPYNFNSGFTLTLLNSNINVLNGAYTTSGYDLGMLFHFGIGGGLAYLSVVCTNSHKGGGVAGIASTTQVPYFEQSAMHEIGHEFSAGHSMSANTGVCGGGNYMSGSSIEAGGGSSLMAYAGNCGVLAYQSNRNNFFHSNSIQEMLSYIGTTSCATVSSTGHSAPITSTNNKSYNIPQGTPFKLSMTATSSTNSLTYAFDQMDLYGGTGTSSPPSPTATFGPLFRTRVPSADSFRYFPSLNVLLGEESGDFEVLPTIARTINFKGIVRDNYLGGGCKAQENILVNTQNCGPFEFTNLNTATALTANGSNTVTLNWNTANACVPTTNVKISFSTDGGHTYPYVILSSTPNDGTETIIVPNLTTCNGRFMIEAIGNIYFNINRAPISITSTCLANGTKINPDANFTADKGSPTLNLSLSPQYGTAISQPLSGTINASSPSSNLVFLNTASNSCVSSGNATQYQIFEFFPSITGNHTFNLNGSFGLLANLYSGSFDPNNLCSGFLNSTATRNGTSGPVSLNSSFSQALCARQKYTLVVSTFSNGTPTLPANYTVNVTGGTLFNNNPNPGVSFNYGYVIVNTLNGLIKTIKPIADLSNPSTFTAGDYLVYGISTSNSLSALDNTYTGGAFAAFSTAILNQTGGLCAQLSQNFKKVNISIPASFNSVSLKGVINKNQNALLSWEYTDNKIDQFILERSTNSEDFKSLEVFSHINKESFKFEDKTFSGIQSSKVFYRLKMILKNGEEVFSNTVVLTPNSNENPNIKIFPNPIENNTFQIQFQEAITGTIDIKITNILGKQIYSEIFTKEQGVSNKTIVLPSSLPSGIYYLHIQKEGRAYSFKINKL
ncbi:MAG TPA: zinc-dependent metalloprotease family protein [Edaphocola sp.]|nr:zinc-dependent metalloprotease family protein [Edaphocola sp.]